MLIDEQIEKWRREAASSVRSRIYNVSALDLTEFARLVAAARQEELKAAFVQVYGGTDASSATTAYALQEWQDVIAAAEKEPRP